MCRDLKHQDNLQASLELQNLNSSGFSSPPHPYKPPELNLWGNLQEVPPDKCGIVMRPDLIQMEADEILYAPISLSWVTGCERTILVKNNHYGAQLSSSTVLMGSFSSHQFWCTIAPNTLMFSITKYIAIG